MAHTRRALRLAELGLVAVLGAGALGCQTSALTATGADALRAARAEVVTPKPMAVLDRPTPLPPPPPPCPTADVKPVAAVENQPAELAPTVRGVNPAPEWVPERR